MLLQMTAQQGWYVIMLMCALWAKLLETHAQQVVRTISSSAKTVACVVIACDFVSKRHLPCQIGVYISVDLLLQRIVSFMISVLRTNALFQMMEPAAQQMVSLLSHQACTHFNLLIFVCCSSWPCCMHTIYRYLVSSLLFRHHNAHASIIT